MNFPYVNILLKHNRVGKLIRYIEDNVFDFSIDDINRFEEILYDQKVYLYTLLYYLNEINIRNDIKTDITDKDLYIDYLFECDYKLDMFKYILTNNDIDDVFKEYDLYDKMECISVVYDNLELVKFFTSKELSYIIPENELYCNCKYDDRYKFGTYNTFPNFDDLTYELYEYYFNHKNLNMYNPKTIDIAYTLEQNRKDKKYIDMIRKTGLYDKDIYDDINYSK